MPIQAVTAPMPIRRWYPNTYATYAFRASFELFNEAYTLGDQHCECLTCNGTSGFVESEMQGEGAWSGLVYFVQACQDCLDFDQCPGCSAWLGLSFDPSAIDLDWACRKMPILGFSCLVCGWEYDPARFEEQEQDYYEEDDPYAPDDDPRFDPRFLW